MSLVPGLVQEQEGEVPPAVPAATEQTRSPAAHDHLEDETQQGLAGGSGRSGAELRQPGGEQHSDGQFGLTTGGGQCEEGITSSA